MTHCVGFPAVSRNDARVLILGSLPGVESLKQNQYYAKKQNSFWRIMGELIGTSPDMPYKERLNRLKKNKIALWDVCASAHRVGSLDSNIEFATMTANDFTAFFKKHRRIELICFNGQPASKLFTRKVLPDLPSALADIPRITLPSTSPAHAGMRFEEKLRLWRRALEPFIG